MICILPQIVVCGTMVLVARTLLFLVAVGLAAALKGALALTRLLRKVALDTTATLRGLLRAWGSSADVHASA